MKAALLIIDLVQDTFKELGHLPVTSNARAMLPVLNRLINQCRDRGLPIVFSMDSFLREDFLFKGRMKPHSIRGTEGAGVYEGLDFQPGDVFLPKRRFSAFYKTDLDQTLRTWGVDTVAVTGIMTQVCVLATALDALANDFRSVIVEDCCASATEEMHRNCLDLYRKTPVFPLLQVLTAQAFLDLVDGKDA